MKPSAFPAAAFLAASFLAPAAPASAQSTATSATSAASVPLAIDVQRSAIVIHVGKAGMLSAAGHDHWIAAPIASGTLQESPAPRIEFTIETARMSVKPDPKIDEKTEATIQQDMQEMTLETKKFPQITFHSTHIENVGEGQWKVEGALSLHGVTKTVTLMANRAGVAYNARTVLKQTDFGITPISVGGGMIKVRNEVEIDFQIVPVRP